METLGFDTSCVSKLPPTHSFCSEPENRPIYVLQLHSVASLISWDTQHRLALAVDPKRLMRLGLVGICTPRWVHG